MAASMLLMTACEQSFDHFEKTKFDGKDISGVWAYVNNDISEFYDFDCGVAEVIIFDGNTVSLGSIMKDDGICRFYEYKDGYIYGCTYDDIKITYTTDMKIEDEVIYFTEDHFGYSDTNTIKLEGQKLTLNTGIESRTFEKVKGFKLSK